MIHLNCEKCGHCYRVREKYSGRKARCGQCGHINIVPVVYRIALDSVSVPRAGDGVTLDFNALYSMLVEQERRIPAFTPAGRHKSFDNPFALAG